ncbi:pesticin C-terminus-like muramidase [Pseudomonas sp. MWU12-2037]|uniref:pesticin C-terminus-like muramidase n=1 Tax=Pseudomonas sp. MWU12-2037 TaxID=2928690 RepID=UPI00200E62A8|nr:pesticin C-terminus-like muramidase [Pseudomonas sp. MWU12-2037]
MKNANKRLAWCFPFKVAGARSREVADPQTCYDALAKATGGTYPLGQGGLWHGGVHFDKNTAALLDQEAVRCIADGEVIAYRIDQAYPTSPKANGEPAAYSTGFVLIKHCLSLPGQTYSAISPLPPQSLTFYSLYMHLLSWEHYQRDPGRARPAFWMEEPQAKARVISLDTPFAIKAGALIGHPGIFSTPSHGDGEGLLHLEVFSCDDVPAFIEKSRAYAASLPESERSLARISRIASALVPHTPDINASHPPKMAKRSLRTLPGLILPRVVLDNLPSDHRIRDTFALPGLKPYTQHWWHLKNRMADASGQRVSGWLGESALFFDDYSPWDWAGFDCLRETTCHSEQLACHFQAMELFSKAQQADYDLQVHKANNGPIKTRLRQIIQGNADSIAVSPLLTPKRIRAALDNPHHAQAISQLIVHYESEWFWNPAKWNELDHLLRHSDSEPNKRWEQEKKRIQKLSWWAELAGKHGINPDGKAWYFHPIGLLANFVVIEDENDLKWLTVERGQLTFDVEGNDIDDPTHPLHIYFSRKVHWPGGASGITIGRGYDLGQNRNAEADLAAANIPEPLYSWLIGAKGLRGQAARNYLKAASSEIKRLSISRKQQHELFQPVYDFMESEVLRVSEKTDITDKYGKLNWHSTHRAIKDLIVDLRYRGDYDARSRALLQRHLINNDLDKLYSVISTPSNWPNVPSDRFNRRISYLDKSR